MMTKSTLRWCSLFWTKGAPAKTVKISKNTEASICQIVEIPNIFRTTTASVTMTAAATRLNAAVQPVIYVKSAKQRFQPIQLLLRPLMNRDFAGCKDKNETFRMTCF
jgi:hypothetical protein